MSAAMNFKRKPFFLIVLLSGEVFLLPDRDLLSGGVRTPWRRRIVPMGAKRNRMMDL
jgi:hypothetical protein